MEKRTPLSEIPGFRYGLDAVVNLPKPVAWNERKLTPAAVQSVHLKALGVAMHDPSMPELPDLVHGSMDARLQPVIQFCKKEQVNKLAGLLEAPLEVRVLVQNPSLRPEILKYLMWRRSSANPNSAESVRVYADEEE